MIHALIPALVPIVEKLVGLIPDKNAQEKARAEATAQLLEMAMKSQAEQVDINRVEAANPNVFVSGWRPFIGWVGGVALAYTFLMAPFCAWLLSVYSPGTPLPSIPTENLFELVFAMLGLGGLRTFEKIRGVARS